MGTTKVRIVWGVAEMGERGSLAHFFKRSDAVEFCRSVSAFPGSHQVERNHVVAGIHRESFPVL